MDTREVRGVVWRGDVQQPRCKCGDGVLPATKGRRHVAMQMVCWRCDAGVTLVEEIKGDEATRVWAQPAISGVCIKRSCLLAGSCVCVAGSCARAAGSCTHAPGSWTCTLPHVKLNHAATVRRAECRHPSFGVTRLGVNPSALVFLARRNACVKEADA
eukprot:350976-Chlamydomonas_euryale.AAC.2